MRGSPPKTLLTESKKARSNAMSFWQVTDKVLAPLDAAACPLRAGAM
jgi:hypothetical protein